LRRSSPGLLAAFLALFRRLWRKPVRDFTPSGLNSIARLVF